MPDPLPIAKNEKTELRLLPALANRHGLITGATGKTVTLQVMAERFSRIGVPVFIADIDDRTRNHPWRAGLADGRTPALNRATREPRASLVSYGLRTGDTS